MPDDSPLSNLRSRKALALLLYLACNPGPHRREFLAVLLWDASSTAQSRSNLRTVLTRLRSYADNSLGDYLQVTPETIALAPDADIGLDVAVLEETIAATAGAFGLEDARHLE